MRFLLHIMSNKSNLSVSFNTLTQKGLNFFIEEYGIPQSLHPVLPSDDRPVYPFPAGKFSVYTRLFDYCNYRVPFTRFLIRVLMFHDVHISQMNPFGLAKVSNFELSCRSLDRAPNLDVF